MHHHESVRTTDLIDESEAPSGPEGKTGIALAPGAGGGGTSRGGDIPRLGWDVGSSRRTVTYVLILGAILRFSIRVPVGETKRGRRERSGRPLLRISFVPLLDQPLDERASRTGIPHVPRPAVFASPWTSPTARRRQPGGDVTRCSVNNSGPARAARCAHRQRGAREFGGGDDGRRGQRH